MVVVVTMIRQTTTEERWAISFSRFVCLLALVRCMFTDRFEYGQSARRMASNTVRLAEMDLPTDRPTDRTHSHSLDILNFELIKGVPLR